jgi:hypothetical protein
MCTGSGDDLARMADLLGLRVPSPDLDREAPQIRALLAEQDALRALPLDDQAPAFTPRLASGGPDATE